MAAPLANFDRERRAFAELCESDCRKCILLFQGESGTGKTSLITYCLASLPEGVQHLAIQLRSSAVSVAEIFYRSGTCLGWQHLSHFRRQVDEMQEGARIQVDHNTLSGINNSIRVALQADNLSDREQRRAALTDAWFEDVKSLECPTLVALDTYEQATTEVQEWIGGPFLARVARTSGLRALIAGQSVPTANNIEWGHCCESYSLFGVPEAKHWLPVARAMKRRLPLGDPLTWLAGVCAALKGRPKEIMQFLEALPSLEDADGR